MLLWPRIPDYFTGIGSGSEICKNSKLILFGCARDVERTTRKVKIPHKYKMSKMLAESLYAESERYFVARQLNINRFFLGKVTSFELCVSHLCCELKLFCSFRTHYL